MLFEYPRKTFPPALRSQASGLRKRTRRRRAQPYVSGTNHRRNSTDGGAHSRAVPPIPHPNMPAQMHPDLRTEVAYRTTLNLASPGPRPVVDQVERLVDSWSVALAGESSTRPARARRMDRRWQTASKSGQIWTSAPAKPHVEQPYLTVPD
ncbi:hypothetical protein BC628DRAFT_768492 [Trametes gibbosa]|nr:hypothetical protein BC628DRAFT_768492 [Trametes gibbosa]